MNNKFLTLIPTTISYLPSVPKRPTGRQWLKKKRKKKKHEKNDRGHTGIPSQRDSSMHHLKTNWWKQTRDRKVASSNPGRSGGKIFFSIVKLCVLTLIRCPFHPRVTAVARKRPRSLRQKCKWQVTPKHAYTLDPTKSEWTDYAAIQALFGNLSANEPTRNLSGNTRSVFSARWEMWSNPVLKNGINVHELISIKKKKKSAGGECIVEHSPKILAREEKATTLPRRVWHTSNCSQSPRKN